MLKALKSWAKSNPVAYFIYQLAAHKVRNNIQDISSVYSGHKREFGEATTAIDLGCGSKPQNFFLADHVFGLDLFEDASCGIIKTRLGFEAIPFENDSVHYITAHDLLEHIPRHGGNPINHEVPLIFLMNEIYRVLKPGGIFISQTPVFPFFAAFQDPTHTNIMTSSTLRLYFSDQKIEAARGYGIKSNFRVSFEAMLSQHYVAVLEKVCRQTA